MGFYCLNGGKVVFVVDIYNRVRVYNFDELNDYDL